MGEAHWKCSEQEFCHKEGSNRKTAKYLSTKMPWITVEEHIADSRAKEKQLFHVVGTQEGIAGSRRGKGHLQRG